MLKSSAPSEVAKWTVAMKWVLGEQTARSKHLNQLLGVLDMAKVFEEDEEFLRKEFQEGSLLGENNQCFKLYTNFLESKIYTKPQAPQRAAVDNYGGNERRRGGRRNVRRNGAIVVEIPSSSEDDDDEPTPERIVKGKRCRPLQYLFTDTDESSEDIPLCITQRPVRSASKRSRPNQPIATEPEQGTSTANLNPPPTEPAPCLVYTEGTSMYSFNWKVTWFWNQQNKWLISFSFYFYLPIFRLSLPPRSTMLDLDNSRLPSWLEMNYMYWVVLSKGTPRSEIVLLAQSLWMCLGLELVLEGRDIHERAQLSLILSRNLARVSLMTHCMQ